MVLLPCVGVPVIVMESTAFATDTEYWRVAELKTGASAPTEIDSALSVASGDEVGAFVGDAVGAGARVMANLVVEVVPSCAVTPNTAYVETPGVSDTVCAVFDVYVVPFAVMVAAVESAAAVMVTASTAYVTVQPAPVHPASVVTV